MDSSDTIFKYIEQATTSLDHNNDAVESLTQYHKTKREIQDYLDEKQQQFEAIIQRYREDINQTRKKNAPSSSISIQHELERVRLNVQVETAHLEDFKNYHARELQELRALELEIARFHSEIDPHATELTTQVKTIREQLRTCEMQVAVYQALSNIQFIDTPSTDPHDLQGIIRLVAMGELRPFKVHSDIALGETQQMFWDMLYEEYQESTAPAYS